MEPADALELINAGIRSLPVYHLAPDETEVKLNQNENPFDWPEPIKREVAEYCLARPWNRYPEFIPKELLSALAKYAGVGPDAVIAGNGSNEMLLVLLLSVASPDRPVIICTPTFSVYRLLSKAVGSRDLPVSLREGLSFNVDAIIDACRLNPRSLLILCSPNNPTGGALTETEIRAIFENHAGMVLLDQAYVEFGGYNAVELLDHYPNLIITRTFSKAIGGAGLRLGYMLGNPQIISAIKAAKLPYNVNFFTAHVATVLTSHPEVLDRNRAIITSERESLFSTLKELPLDNVYPSQANFILIRTDKKEKLNDHLRNAGILVRDVSSYPMLENCLRLSVGTPEENSRLKHSLQEFFN